MGDDLSYEQYVSIMRNRVNQGEKLRKKRFQEAKALAERMVKFIHANYAVDNVYVFGSVLDKDSFRLDSDIDIAVTGLNDGFAGELREKLCSLGSPYKVDLIRLEEYNESFQRSIIEGGRQIAR